MARIYLRFPGNKSKALTFSYDDGVEQDKRLVQILRDHHMKGTFNINSGLYFKEEDPILEGIKHRRMKKSECLDLYLNSGMEVASHCVTHPFITKLPKDQITYEVVADRASLEETFHCLVRGGAYPYGCFSDEVVEVLRLAGIQYYRTVISSHKFDLPEDWLRLPATCHHKDPDLMKLAEDFLNLNVRFEPKMFYLWGHSYEFDDSNNWEVIEHFCDYMQDREDLWYATNIEIHDYVEAYNHLISSLDGKRLYNPTAYTIDLFSADLNKPLTIHPKETLEL